MRSNLLGIALGTLVAFGASSTLAAQAPEGATAKCKDDTYSTSTSHRGACKGHGGVAEWLSTAKTTKTKSEKKSKTEAKAAATETAAVPAGPAPAGATAACKDGTYSTSTSHRGACKGHGGVSEWLAKTETKTKTKSKKETAKAAASEAAPPAEAAAPAATAPAAPAAKMASPVAKAPPGNAPADATALCKDGTYSHSQHHRGACSDHGGVQQWLKDIPE